MLALLADFDWGYFVSNFFFKKKYRQIETGTTAKIQHADRGGRYGEESEWAVVLV